MLEKVFVFLVGLCLGSFVGACAYRMPRGLSLITERSMCARCKNKIPWIFNIPLLSCVMLGARCKQCFVHYGWQHFWVELLSGLWALTVFHRYGVSWQGFYVGALGFVLVTLSLIDLEFRIIPDEFSLGGTLVGILAIALCWALGEEWFVSEGDAFLGLVLGGGGLWLTAVLFEKITGKEGLGFGDVKLMMLFGIHAGVFGVLWTIFLGSLFGVIGWLCLKIFSKVERNTQIPFGPYLSLGFIVYFWFSKTLMQFLG